jgi:hypothetical protein
MIRTGIEIHEQATLMTLDLPNGPSRVDAERLSPVFSCLRCPWTVAELRKQWEQAEAVRGIHPTLLLSTGVQLALRGVPGTGKW